jgi:hypothetical protein
LRPAGDIKDQFSAAGIVGQGRVFAREQDRAGFQSSPNELRLYAHRPRGAWLWSFSEAKLQQLNAAGTYRVYGHALEFERDAATAGVAAARRWRLIQPCLCVQDSPQNPCPCDTGMFWWLLADAVIGEGNAGRKDHRGQELQFFDVLVDSKIMVESVRPVSAGLLKGLGENISAEVVLQAACWPELGGLGIIESKLIPIPPGAKKAIIAFVTLVIEKALEPLIDEILKPIWPPPDGRLPSRVSRLSRSRCSPKLSVGAILRAPPGKHGLNAVTSGPGAGCGKEKQSEHRRKTHP